MRTHVVIPTYNERANLPLVVAGLLDTPDVSVLVVDDGSPDGTGEVADDIVSTSGGRVLVLHRRGPRGLGRAYLDGFRLALETDADVICHMDADLSHQPAALPALLRQMDRADLVIGSRYVRGGRTVNWPLRRRLLSRFANQYVKAITGLPVNDCTGGFRCWRRDLLLRLPLHHISSDGYSWHVEMTWEAARAGARIAEVPITFVERRNGVSKMNAGVIAESALMPWRIVLRAPAKAANEHVAHARVLASTRRSMLTAHMSRFTRP